MRFWRYAALGLTLLSLAGCVGAGSGSGKDQPQTGNPITGDAIEVTALGAPGTAAPLASPPAAPAAAAAAPAGGEVKPAAAATPAPAGGEAAGGEAAAAAEPAAPAVLVVKSPGQLACEKRKGHWSGSASGIGICVSYTKDASKACSRSGECQGECLARSGSCAPVTPLYGCHEILDAMGRKMTQCLQ